MNVATKTRTQRRMEKKQALILLVLVLVASLASFTLGVIVGRRGAERDFVLKQQAAEKVLVAPAPNQAMPVPAAQSTTQAEAPAEQQAAAVSKTDTKLTFYDDLNKAGGAPIGSGINMPPAKQKTEAAAQQTAQPTVQPAPAQQATKPASQVAKAVETKTDTAQILPKVASKGAYCLQVGSFATAGEAGKLKQRLLAKKYPTYIAEADLGKKGIWYRVRLGPYADKDAANSMRLLLEKQERIKGFVTRK